MVMKVSIFDKSGSVMILVLWTLAMLTMMSGYYAVEARIRRNIGHNVMAALQGKYCVRAVLSLVAGRIAPYESATSASGTADINEDEENMFRADGSEYRMQFAGREVRFRIEDERGKLDINTASEDDIKSVMRSFISDTELADTISDSILDWRDRDKLVRASGAEDETYEDKRPAYRAANGKFLFQQELLLVNGVNAGLFYGPVKWSSVDGDEDTEEWKGGLSDLVTIYNGGGKILMDIAPPPIVAALGESQEAGTSQASGTGSVYRLVIYVDALVYHIFWSQGSGKDKFIIHEWQESPEESA